MYKVLKKPFFPRLVRVDENDESNYPLYRLDWFQLEKRIEDKYLNHPEWKRKKLFPDNHIEWLKSLRFSIGHKYMEAIRYSTKKAVEAYDDIPLGLDTLVRDFCCKPGEAHVEVAFFLLADVLEKSLRKTYLPCLVRTALLIYFWQEQTGLGLVLLHSRFEQLCEVNRKFHNNSIITKFTDDVISCCNQINNAGDC